MTAQGICDAVQTPCLVPQRKGEFLQVCHPLGMTSTQLVLAIDVLQGLMIGKQNKLLLY